MDTRGAISAERCSIQQSYFKSLLGIAKMLQILFSILTFSLSISCSWSGQGGGWVNFVAFTGFVSSTIWFIFHLFNIMPNVLANFFIEMISYVVYTLFFFIAAIVASARGYLDGVVVATAVFAFFCFFAFGLDALVQVVELRKIWKERNDRRPVSTNEHI